MTTIQEPGMAVIDRTDTPVDKYNREHASPLCGFGPACSLDDGRIGVVFTVRF